MKKLPYNLIPFVLGMFIIVGALNTCGFTQKISDLLIDISNENKFLTSLSYGYSSIVTSNLLNNISMSVLFSNILNMYSGSYKLVAIFASILGSNIGALLTPIGALAGIMWMGMLKEKNININFLSFIKCCGLISLISAFVGLILIIFVI